MAALRNWAAENFANAFIAKNEQKSGSTWYCIEESRSARLHRFVIPLNARMSERGVCARLCNKWKKSSLNAGGHLVCRFFSPQ